MPKRAIRPSRVARKSTSNAPPQGTRTESNPNRQYLPAVAAIQLPHNRLLLQAVAVAVAAVVEIHLVE
jgi:hypothetical protein